MRILVYKAHGRLTDYDAHRRICAVNRKINNGFVSRRNVTTGPRLQVAFM